MKKYNSTKHGGFHLRQKFLFAAIVVLLSLAAGVFAQSHDILYPCLVDLSGWNADAPEGMKMDMGGMKMINAHRRYSQGDKELNALIVIGNPQMAGIAPPGQSPGKMETDKGRISVETIKGFQVQIVYDKVDKSGGITVILLPGQDGGAFFTMTYEGMTDSDALGLAERFDWNLMKNKALQFK
jgi:hypothetical protein